MEVLDAIKRSGDGIAQRKDRMGQTWSAGFHNGKFFGLIKKIPGPGTPLQLKHCQMVKDWRPRRIWP